MRKLSTCHPHEFTSIFNPVVCNSFSTVKHTLKNKLQKKKKSDASKFRSRECFLVLVWFFVVVLVLVVFFAF